MMKKILGFIGIAALVAGAVLGVIYFLKRRSEQAQRDNFNLDDYDFDDCCCDCDDDCTCGCKEGKPCTCHGECKGDDDCDDVCDCGCKDE